MPVEVLAPNLSGPPPDYCCAVVMDDSGCFWLERRPVTKQHAPGRLTCFGGRRESAEDPYAALVRELREELGFVPADLAEEPSWALYVDGALIAWFYAAPVYLEDPEPTLEDGVELVRLPVTALDHPDLSTWHRPVLEQAR